MKSRLIVCLLGAVCGAGALVASSLSVSSPTPIPYHSPYDLAFSTDGSQLAISDRTAGIVSVMPAGDTGSQRQITLHGQPAGVAWNGKTLYVAEYGSGTVAEIRDGKVMRRLPVGRDPLGLAVAPKRRLLLAANSSISSVSVIDLATGIARATIPVVRSPFAAAITPDERMAVVGNLLPLGDAANPETSAAISLIDLKTLRNAGTVRMPAGATALRGIAISSDGKWAYCVHTIGHTSLPTTQIERGWVNTNALTIVNLLTRKIYATVLLDLLSEGAADPWGICVSRDDSRLWVSIAGVHQIANLDLTGMHKSLAAMPEDKRAELVNDLAYLHSNDLMVRTPAGVRGPRGIAISPDGKQLAVAGYFSGKTAILDPVSGDVRSFISAGKQRVSDVVRHGEEVFYDGSYSFQHWLSCASCHPDSRTDGLNWDLLNDGIGNPKNTKSLVLSAHLGKMMARGIRDSMYVAAAAGFRFIEFREPEPKDLKDCQSYIASLKPEMSPYRQMGGSLSASAKRGKAIFEEKAQCSVCHKGEYFTDFKLHDVGTVEESDKGAKFVTPTLREVWRTAPYMAYGHATTIQQVLTKYNPRNSHGATKGLSKKQLDDLTEYVLSL